MNDSNTYPFFFSQIPAAPWSLQSEGISIQYDDVQPDIVMDTATPACCERACGAFIPLVINGNYNDPNGGRNYIGLALSASPECGIPVSRVLNGNLEGLIGRDDVVVLNPKSNSIRLRIELPGYEPFKPKIPTPNGELKIEDLVHKVCAQLKKFKLTARGNVRTGPDPKWMVSGEGRIAVEQLVLVSLKRTTIGTWVPLIRLVNGQNGD